MSHQAYGPRTGVPRILRLLDRQQDPRHLLRARLHRRALAGRRSARSATPATRSATTATCTRERTRRRTRRRRSVACCAASRRWTRCWRAPGWLSRADVGATYRLPALLAKPWLPVRLGPDGRRPSVPAGHFGPSAEPRSFVELPGHWSLDDWEPYNYLPGITGTGLIASPGEVLARWTLELEALVAEGGLFMLTNHPFVSGRASRAVGARDADRAGEGDRRAVDRIADQIAAARGDAAADARGPSAPTRSRPRSR